jgi:hypothetical protein
LSLSSCKIAIKQNKLAHKQWKEAGKSKRPEHPLFLRKVETRKIYRTEIRKEESKRKHEERDKIINAQSYNKKIFYRKKSGCSGRFDFPASFHCL